MAVASYRIIGIAGGIGSGKSVVSRVCRLNGYEVYDCDYRARIIMDSSVEIRSVIASLTDGSCLDSDGHIDRKKLSVVFFRDPVMRGKINSIVHSAVVEDVLRMASQMETPLFVESAIMRSSGLVSICDCIWHVRAPESLRVERVAMRSGLSPDEIRLRILAQEADEDFSAERIPVVELDNSGNTSLLLAVDRLCKEFGYNV